MELDEIKRGLRAEIKKRENEQYFTFQCNVRQMCKDVLAKLEEQESVIAELQKQVHDYAQGLYVIQARAEKEARRHNYKRCMDNAWWCRKLSNVYALIASTHRGWKIARYYDDKAELYRKWHKRWLKIADQLKETK